MIDSVRLEYFKCFREQRFDLADHIILAGPNNGGKTTLIQAINVWSLALRKWLERRGPLSGSQAKLRTGVPVTRSDFTPVPLRVMDDLWTDTATGLRKEELEEGQKLGQPRVLTVELVGHDQVDATRQDWTLGFELRYQNTELVYVKPIQDHLADVERAAKSVSVVHVPPFSGIGSEEPKLDLPYQDLLIGQGKAGDIIRNLLLQVHKDENKTLWTELVQRIEEIFGYRLLPPEYSGTPYILAQYVKGIPTGHGTGGFPTLDIASAGSGFHQVLLLLAFLYARPAAVLLLDEPDAHLHVVLQKQIYDELRRIAMKRHAQLVIATHAEVLIDSTNPQDIISFYRQPHRLISDADRDQVREAIRRLPATDILLAERAKAVLYVEDRTDFEILRSFATVLDHPVREWFSKKPFWHSNRGRHPREAKGHFFALKAIDPDIRASLLLDGDDRGLPDREIVAEGLEIRRWKRYEIESYLLHPAAIERFVVTLAGPLMGTAALNHLADELPPAVLRDPLGDHPFFATTPVSKTVLPDLFAKLKLSVRKQDYYMLAEQMRPNEIPSEVRDVLDLLKRVTSYRQAAE